MDKKFLIIPANTDLNRGDQALVWETVNILKDSGNIGKYYMLKGEESIKQSEEQGLIGIKPILAHPSRLFKDKENSKYNLLLKIKWGVVALLDFIASIFYLNKFTRKIMKIFISKEKKDTIQQFEECESLYVKGGGFLHTYGGVESTYIMYFFLFHIILAQKIGKKVYVMPNSFGPFKGFLVKPLLKYTLKRCEIVCSRESASTKMLMDELYYKVETYPDLGFFLEKDINNKNVEIINNIKRLKSSGKKCVGITVRPYRFPKSSNPDGKYYQYINSFRKFIDWLSDNGYYVVLVEHTLSVCTNESDGISIRDIIKGLDTKEYLIVSNDDLNCRELKAIYAQCDFVVGTRFHSVIFSMSEEIPCVAITYGGNKGEGIMNDMGQSEAIIKIEDVSYENLLEKFRYINENRELIISKIKNYKEYAIRRRKELIDKLKNNKE